MEIDDKLDDKIVKEINCLDRYTMCKLWRFAPMGNIYFSPPYGEIFKKRLFEELGGFNPEISKKLGW